MKKTHRFSVFLLAFAVWVGVSLACVGISSTSLTPISKPAKTSTATALSLTPTIPSSKLGDVVEQFGYSLSATQIEYPTSQDTFNAPKPGYKLVAVDITLGNVSGAEPLSVFSNYVYLVDTNGFVYQSTYGGESGIGMVVLNTGEKTKGWVYFTIPDSATPAYIKYQINDNGTGDQKFLIMGLAK
jgi:hypothetical protein